MDFNADLPIYRQIAELCYNRILSGAWVPGARVPSVRELAVELAVNSHTVLKAYEYLQTEQIIAPRRGLGYFLADDAPERVVESRRREFFSVKLPEIFAEMDRLGITLTDLTTHYHSR